VATIAETQRTLMKLSVCGEFYAVVMSPVLPKPELTSHPVDVGLRTEGAILSELVRGGAAQFSAQSVQSNPRGTRTRGYAGEVDLFIVYCSDNESVYVIPAEEVPNCGMYLRVDPPRNRQNKRVRWAKEYELPA
jgi:hypothetical protein